MLKFKKYRVRRFAPSPERVLDKFLHGERFFPPYGKNSINNLSLATSRVARNTGPTRAKKRVANL
jgi:hypothetical protein